MGKQAQGVIAFIGGGGDASNNRSMGARGGDGAGACIAGVGGCGTDGRRARVILTDFLTGGDGKATEGIENKVEGIQGSFIFQGHTRKPYFL